MDTFSWKGTAAVFGTLLFILIVRVVAVAVLEPENLTNPEYIVKGLFVQIPSGAVAPPAEPMPDWKAVLAAADIDAGKTVAARCQGCHNLSKENETKFGPPLYGVVGRPRARPLGSRVENSFDTNYQEVIGCATAGIAAHGGVRIRFQ